MNAADNTDWYTWRTRALAAEAELADLRAWIKTVAHGLFPRDAPDASPLRREVLDDFMHVWQRGRERGVEEARDLRSTVP